MIRPDGLRGAAFGEVADGDGRSDPAARTRIAAELRIPAEWAFVRQVHGSDVVEAFAPGSQGSADAILTAVANLPITIATADCVPIVIEAPSAVAVVHAGWRGIDAGVIEATLDALRSRGHHPTRAAIGPGIGACCYEVGPEVAGRFPASVATTTWSAQSVDLAAEAQRRLGDLTTWVSGSCTCDDHRFHSYRRDATSARQVAVGWLPSN